MPTLEDAPLLVLLEQLEALEHLEGLLGGDPEFRDLIHARKEAVEQAVEDKERLLEADHFYFLQSQQLR
jgi:hypothetical protein